MKSVLLIAAVILLIRLPFLNQAVQGDDVYYIRSAEHAQIDPFHPNHTLYVFQGVDVDFRGYTHPPLNAWFLGILIACFGELREVPFHAAYIVFSVIAAFSMYSLARRFSPHPLWATLLFTAVPAFVVNGNSFESDVPFLAFWMSGIALFISGHDRNSRGLLVVSGGCLAMAALAASQAVFAIPILAIYARRRWLVIAMPLLATAAWQVFEYFSMGQFPFAIAAGYEKSYNLQRLSAKLRHGASLAVHLAYLAWPLALVGFFRGPQRRDTRFLILWIAVFFAGAVAVFPAGSARYLLPLAAPVMLLISRLPAPILAAYFAVQLTISLLLATVNYQHWDAYRQFAHSISGETRHRRTWVNADWGLRYYLELEGARPVHKDQHVSAGDLLVTSELALPVGLSHGGSTLVPIATREIRSAIPLRLIGLETGSAYSSDARGFFPFGISTGAIDRLRADIVQSKAPTREDVLMSDRSADDQILSGIFPGDPGENWRWMGREATLILKSPEVPTPLRVGVFIHDAVPARVVTLSLDGKQVVTRTFAGPGTYSIESGPLRPDGASALLTITVDKTISPPGDSRRLGLILTEAGFRK